MMRKHQEQKTIRRYLLEQLSESKRQKVEVRLLSDEAFVEELEFVEDELVDEYIAGKLPADERLRFERTFLAHPGRKHKLRGGQALKRYLDANSPVSTTPTSRLQSLRKWLSQLFLSSPIGVVVALLAVLVVGLGVWRGVIYQSDLEKGLIALNEAYSVQRPTEARVSNLKHAPFISTRSGEPKPVNELERRRAERFLSDAFEDNRSADSYHALGRLYLLQREPEKAIALLEEARKVDSNNPQIYADLGAAYLEKGKAELENSRPEQPNNQGLADLGRSLEYLKQGLELDSNLLEALFNQALVHQHQELFNLAKSDWRAYLEKDSSSPWAVEAQQNLKKLEEQEALGSQNIDGSLEAFLRAYNARDDEAAWDLYKRQHGSSGNAITNAIVDNLLANNPNQQSVEYLRALNYLGQLEVSRTQDSYTFDLSKIYARASTQTLRLLAQARQQMLKGRGLLRQSRISEANEFLKTASITFEKTGNFPESLAAQTAMAQGAVVEPNLTKAQETLARIMPICESRKYKWLLGQTIYHQAHLQSNLTNHSQAIIDGNHALRIFTGLEDVNGILGSLVQLATLHLSLNDVEKSLSYLRRALIVANHSATQLTQVWGLHIAISLNLRILKLYRAALDYQNEALQLFLLKPKAALYRSRSYQFIGLTFSALGHVKSAVENMQLAYEQGKLMATEPNGVNMMANASLGLGDVYRSAGNPSEALKAYDESLRLYDTLGFNHYKYAAHKGKFLAYRAQNDDAMAAHELQIVIDLFEQYRGKILNERQRNFFFDREQDVYDLAIDYTYSRLNDESGAFNYSETSRARNLRELMRHGAEITESDSELDLRVSRDNRANDVTTLTATHVENSLPENLQLVQYAVLEKKLVIWHISRSKILAKTVSLDSTELAELVTKTLKQIRRRDHNNAAASLTALHDLIIEPIRDRLDPNQVLCFVPDKVLHYVPFAALFSRNNGHFLVQDFRVLVSPSATILIDSSKNASQRPWVKHERLLAVGNPAFDRQTNPNLQNLPEAQREVEAIRENYQAPKVLVGSQATKKSIIGDLPKVHVVHFAAHYELDAQSNLLSRFVLAPEPGEPADGQSSGLRARDIYGMNLERVRLAILAGCTTGIEQQFSGEGPIGFARSFLVAGVPVVVASLWPVDSDATAELMIAFHRYRKRHNLPTTDALMRAQQDMIAKAKYNDPYYWAGFLVVGGYSEF